MIDYWWREENSLILIVHLKKPIHENYKIRTGKFIEELVQKEEIRIGT